MTIDSVDHLPSKIPGIGAAGRERTFVTIEHPQNPRHTPEDSADLARAEAISGPAVRAGQGGKSEARLRLGQLSDDAMRRATVYVAVGLVAGCVVLAARNVGSERHTWWGWLLLGAPLTWLFFLGTVAVVFATLGAGVRVLRGAMWLVSRTPKLTRVAVLGCLAGLAGALVMLVGSGAVCDAIVMPVVFVLPCAIVVGVGVWLAVRTDRRWRHAGRRWQRHAAYLLLVPVAAAAVLTLGARDTLAAQVTVGLLFPVAVWLAVRTWRAMNACPLFVVRALSDITVFVMLGFTLVALVWLADALHMPHMPPPEAATVQEALRLTGEYADLPQWWWIGLYALMASASVIFARVCPQPRQLPAEATFSLLSPRRHPRITDRSVSPPLTALACLARRSLHGPGMPLHHVLRRRHHA
jgi:hypothetical protein